ncbi:hypothetical protein ACB092_08G082200 [Castanea dentata]
MPSPPLLPRARRASSINPKTPHRPRSTRRCQKHKLGRGASPWTKKTPLSMWVPMAFLSSLPHLPSPFSPARTLAPISNSGTQIKISTEPTCIYSLIIDNLVIFVWVWICMESSKSVLPEGLPTGMVKEFEDSLRPALLVRQSFLDLHDNFRRIVYPPLTLSHSKGPKLRKQVVLDGPVSCGKSIALAMLVHWARDEGWLVFYVPRGRDWTHGGFFYKNPNTGLWDTPLQAENVLKDFLKWNESHLKQLPCQISDPIPLGEGAGVGQLKDVDNMAMPEGSTLYDLVNTGIKHTHAAVGVVVRLRKELSLVKNIPVLIAIDQYNSWFTFSEYEEAVKVHSRRPVHARELTMVNAFRSMMHDDMMVGAFSHSTTVGKLRKDLPDVPEDARVNCPRYTLDEAASVCHYYLSTT